MQAVGPPVPSDGGGGVVPTRPEQSRRSTTRNPSPPPASSRPGHPVPGVTQVQVGCVEHCHGTTTLDHSGLTLAQIEQLLGRLQPPSPPAATAPTGAPAASGGDQNVTQQAAAESQTGDGSQSQIARQTNGTVQVVGQTDGIAQVAAGPGGAPAGTGPGAAPAAAVNQTAQGVVQLQVGCIFYCSGTRQIQQAQQSNTTVQSVNSAGAGAANTVSRVAWQVQVGCVAWCDNAVETQTAGTSDSTIVTVAPPPAPSVPVVVAPDVPAPAPGQSPSPAPGVGTRDSGGAPIQVPGVGRAAGPGDAEHPMGGGGRVTATSVSVLEQVGSGAALVSVAASRAVETRAADGGRPQGRRGARPSRHAARPTLAVPGPSVVAASSAAQPTLELAIALALALAALGLTGLHRRGVR